MKLNELIYMQRFLEEDEKEVNIDVFGNEIISCWHHEDVTQCDDCIDKLT